MNTSSLVQKVWNFCHTLRAAFADQLVPQDPNDEPAGVVLARIRAERAKYDQRSSTRRTQRNVAPEASA